jgi:hypothetical protein
VALVCALAGPAYAADSLTVNTTSAYVDPSVAAEFVTTPNLCTEPIGSQGTNPLGCGELGQRAVQAIQDASPYGDVYWEPSGSFLQATNAFVPGNEGSNVGNTGYSPLFTFHKYDLFGRPGDRMGPFNREEILFLGSIATTGGGITNGQTTPGEDTKLAYVAALLMNTEGATTYNLGGHTFDYAEMAFYTQVTGFTSGKRTTVINWCNATIGPALCGVLTDEQIGAIYVAVNFPEIQTEVCGTQQNGLINSTNCKNRDEWINQVVTGYVEAWESLGGDDHFAQNFRSQVGYDPNATILDSGTQVWTDFRLEQSVELSGAFTTRASDPGDAITPGDNVDGIAGRQTFEVAFAAVSGPLGGLEVKFGQMVSQDVEGYLMNCFNCNNPQAGVSHAFEPEPQDLTFMPYQSGWDAVPTVVHGGQ